MRGAMKRVALLCEVLHPPLDEGVRILAAEIARAMSRRCQVTLMGEIDAEVAGLPVQGVLTDRFFASRALRRSLSEARPDAVLYVPWTSLTPRTFFRVAVLKRRSLQAPVGVIALQPRSTGLLARLGARFGSPDRLFAMGPEVERQAGRLGLQARRLEGGVDLDRFRPLGEESIRDLRRALGLPASPYIVLHVGHLKPGRGVLALKAAQAIPDVQAVFVGSTSTDSDPASRSRLQEAGVRVVERHLPDIEAYYRAADAYLFPVTSSLDAIELPLSVLEAMACDLPLITTKFGGLPALLGPPRPGVAFIGSEKEIPPALESFMKERPRPGLRALVRKLSWDAMAERILEGFVSHPGPFLRPVEAGGR
jgi:glycosyltransferase involved in cell wall biosynthesis